MPLSFRRASSGSPSTGFAWRTGSLAVFLVLALILIVQFQQRAQQAVVADPTGTPERRVTDRIQESPAAFDAAPVGKGAPKEIAIDEISGAVDKEDADLAAGLPLVDPSRLIGFSDDDLNIEGESYYYLLELARSGNATAMESVARTDLPLDRLRRESNRLRGELAFQQGVLRRIRELPAEENPLGLTTLYEAWIYPRGFRFDPCVVVMAERPTDFPVAEDLREDVEFAGYFLGWWRYATQDKKMTSAPIFVAKRIKRPATQTDHLPAEDGLRDWLGIGIGMILVVGLLASFYWTIRSNPLKGRPNAPPSSSLAFDDPPFTSESNG